MSHARGMAYIMVEWLDENFFVIGAKEGVEVRVAVGIFYPYLARVILCLQKSKRAAENHGVTGFPNCAFKDLYNQIALTFDADNDLQAAFESLDIDATHSMAFPEQSLYKIFPRHENRTHLSGKWTQP
jgi:hypothetical protein